MKSLQKTNKLRKQKVRKILYHLQTKEKMNLVIKLIHKHSKNKKRTLNLVIKKKVEEKKVASRIKNKIKRIKISI
jgi:hypothetical protein